MAADRPGPIVHLRVDVATTGPNILVPAPEDGMSVILINCNLITSAAVVVTFEDSPSGIDRIGPWSFAPNGGISMPDSMAGWTKTASGQGLSLRLSADVQVAGSIAYRLTPT